MQEFRYKNKQVVKYNFKHSTRKTQQEKRNSKKSSGGRWMELVRVWEDFGVGGLGCGEGGEALALLGLNCFLF